MIIDAHVHIGDDVVFDEAQNEKEVLDAMDLYGIDGGIVQPFIPRMYVQDIRRAHDEIYAMCRNSKKKLWGMASMNPHFTPVDYEGEITRCVKELGFVGIKIATAAHCTFPGSRDGLAVFEIARKLNVPVMIHTGLGIPLSDPIAIWRAAEAFLDVKIVVAHGGLDMFNEQAILLAEKYDNVWLEPSWIHVLNKKKMLKILGPSKLMFSSDNIRNIPIEKLKYSLITDDPVVLDQIYYKTAVEVFNLKLA